MTAQLRTAEHDIRIEILQDGLTNWRFAALSVEGKEPNKISFHGRKSLHVAENGSMADHTVNDSDHSRGSPPEYTERFKAR
jgi:hypothetical protein